MPTTRSSDRPTAWPRRSRPGTPACAAPTSTRSRGTRACSTTRTPIACSVRSARCGTRAACSSPTTRSRQPCSGSCPAAPRSRTPRRSRPRRPRARRRRLVSDALAEVERRLAAPALEGLAERELVAEAEPPGDLLDRQVAEAQQARGLEQHAVEDQLLGGLAGELREDARQRA